MSKSKKSSTTSKKALSFDDLVTLSVSGIGAKPKPASKPVKRQAAKKK